MGGLRKAGARLVWFAVQSRCRSAQFPIGSVTAPMNETEFQAEFHSVAHRNSHAVLHLVAHRDAHARSHASSHPGIHAQETVRSTFALGLRTPLVAGSALGIERFEQPEPNAPHLLHQLVYQRQAQGLMGEPMG